MGLLIMHAYGRHLLLAAFLGAGILLPSCGGFHVNEALRPSPIDWPMAGKTSAGAYADPAEHTALPLVVKWDADISAGAAQNAFIVVDSVLVCGTLRGELIAFDAVSGKEIGTKKNSAPIAGAPASIGNEIFYCTEAGKETVFDYNLWDGEFVWKKNLGGITASPVVVRISGRASGTAGKASPAAEYLLCFGTLDGMFFALRASDGEVLWKSKCAAPIAGAACAVDSLVFCADTHGTVYAFSTASGALRWKRTLDGAVYAGLSADAHGTVYAGSRDHNLYALDALTGGVRWKYDCGERVMAAASVSDSLIVVPALNGTVAALAPGSGQLKWKFTARSAVNTPCPIVQGVVFAASLDTYIYALSSADGSVVWKHSIDARIKTAPIAWNHSLFVIGDDNSIYKFVPKP
jgi:outer membrane protein assembly factor BamB